MPINFHPQRGTILICDFDSGFQPPEMIKVRPIVVVSPRRRTGPGLCTVIPLSSVEPTPMEAYHHRLSPAAYPPARGPMWAKCDMAVTISCSRLDRIKVRAPYGQRQYVVYTMPPEDMAAIDACLRIALGL
ncbi:type II toxin-antitoxin system PemK/MazF family toxin [Azospirillum argentinense]